MPDKAPPSSDQSEGMGCAIATLSINGLLMGLTALSFTQGPYSSPEQELWYRYGSLGFLLAGAVVPALILSWRARRWRRAAMATTLWMVVTLVAFLSYALLSGGGV